ncbi:MAG: multidrug efflux SMR transporter [Flavobacteriales bacterium]|nr:multidrug efflux SMR transporter [Flavobacteriales bacterium]
MNNAWLILFLAGLFETGFAACLGRARESTGTAWTAWMAGFLLCLTLSMLLLYKATRTLPIGTAYAVWTGIGAAGTVLVGILWFREPADLWRMLFLGTLIASIIGLKVVTP